ncbi:NAD-dependent epimerase/dehydratase family protein [Candidatus Fermentibacterales bacterium]|nr:NAD-dependent epimerase/dehydratase family protein [Candidatus Fermentibacterales bacterium]
MRVFVVGAGGFIGSKICCLLSEAGHDLKRHDWEAMGDLDPGHLGLPFDVLVNAAGRLGGHGATMEELRASNVGVPEIVADAWGSGRDFHVIHLSTPGVTGLVPGAGESLPPAPWGEYERTKAEAEELLRARVAGARLTILRPDFVYGPGDRHKLPLWQRAAKGWFPLVGSGKALLRPTYVDDVCRAVLAALPGGSLRADVYNIGGPDVVSMRHLVREIAGSMGTRVRMLPIPAPALRLAARLGPLAPGALSRSRVEMFGKSHYVLTGKAWQAGFRASTGLREGIAATTSWYAAQGLIRR